MCEMISKHGSMFKTRSLLYVQKSSNDSEIKHQHLNPWELCTFAWYLMLLMLIVYILGWAIGNDNKWKLNGNRVRKLKYAGIRFNMKNIVHNILIYINLLELSN